MAAGLAGDCFQGIGEGRRKVDLNRWNHAGGGGSGGWEGLGGKTRDQTLRLESEGPSTSIKI